MGAEHSKEVILSEYQTTAASAFNVPCMYALFYTTMGNRLGGQEIATP